MTEPFQIIDRKTIEPSAMQTVRRRLSQMCGASRHIRLVDYDHGAREIWESPEGQQFSLVYHMGKYELQEVAYNADDVVPLNPP